MKITQIYELLEDIYSEVTGETGVVKEDLSNISDVGATLLSQNYREPYANSLINRIGRMVFVDRPYAGFAPAIIREAWEYGSIMSKSRVKDFQPTENMAWKLEAGQSVDQFIFTPPTVQTTLYNEMVAWEIDCSFVRDQVEQSFTSAAEYDRFISMITTQIQNSEVQFIDSLIMRNINAMMGRRVNKSIAVVDVLALYNATVATPITAAETRTNKDFARFLAYQILLYKDRMKAKTAAFSENASGYTTFTPAEYLHLVLLSDFAKSLDVYLQSDTYHDSFTEIGRYDTVPFWQGSGTSFDIADTSSIYIDLPGITPTATVDRNYIIGCMFDRDACGIINERRNVAVSYNNRGRYWNNFYQVETRLFTDPAENCIVFVLGSGSGTVPTITLDKSTATVAAEATTTITATVTPVGSTVTWESSDEDVATVSSGTVTGVAAGDATVTASVTNDGVTRTASCDVTVTGAAKSKK